MQLQVETGSPVKIDADPDSLAPILINIIGNSLADTPTGGTVTVTPGSDSANAVVRITDTGQGLSATDLIRIFDRFYRVDDQASTGTGVGLTIARSLARAHGGDVTASSPDLGTVAAFEVTPRSAEQANWTSSRSTRSPSRVGMLVPLEVPRASPPRLRGYHVCLIDTGGMRAVFPKRSGDPAGGLSMCLPPVRVGYETNCLVRRSAATDAPIESARRILLLDQLHVGHLERSLEERIGRVKGANQRSGLLPAVGVQLFSSPSRTSGPGWRRRQEPELRRGRPTPQRLWHGPRRLLRQDGASSNPGGKQMLEPDSDIDDAVPHPRDVAVPVRAVRGGRDLVVRMTGCLILALVLWFAAAPARALAQDSDDAPATSVTISEEPGVCSSQGSFCERLLEWTGNETFAETTAWLLGTPLRILIIMGVAILANRLARRSIRSVVGRLEELDLPDAFVSDRRAERTHQRADAVSAMLRSTASVLIYGIAAIGILDTVGVSVVPIIASLGIAGIAIGFGAQTLIEDLISGVMMIIEDQFGVGDRVDVGVVEGDVERLTLRSTVILARNGVRWYVPNSEIRHVANESQHSARASVRIGVAGDTDLRAAAATFHQATLEMVADERWSELGVTDVREPFVAELAENAIVLEQRLFVEPVERRALERALREHLVEAAAEAGIELPNPQIDVNLRSVTSR